MTNQILSEHNIHNVIDNKVIPPEPTPWYTICQKILQILQTSY